MIYAALASVLVITLFMRFVWNRVSPIQICAICAGSSATWITMFIANKIYGFYVDPVILGIFVGGTVVGIMYELAKKLPENRSPLVFKTIFLIAGFWTAHMLLSELWILFAGGLIITSSVAYFFLQTSPKKLQENKTVEELKEKMKKCC